MNLKFRYFLRSLLPTIACLVLQNGAAIFASELLMVIVAAQGRQTYSEFMEKTISFMQKSDFIIYTTLAYAVFGCIFFAVWYSRYRRVSEHRNADTLKGIPGWTFPAAVVFCVSAQVVCAYIITFCSVAFPDWMRTYNEIFSQYGLDGPNVTPALIAYTAFFGPICEELCFRGLTYSYARRSMKHFSANLVQAFLFAGMHMNPLQSVYAFAFGFVLGEFYGRCRNIYFTILLHICFNGIGLVINDMATVGSTPVSFYVLLLGSLTICYAMFTVLDKALSVQKERLGAAGETV